MFDTHPFNTLESYFVTQSWHYERTDPNLIHLETSGDTTDYDLTFLWQESVNLLHLAVRSDLTAQTCDSSEFYKLLCLINAEIIIGFFVAAPEDGAPVYRLTLPLRTENLHQEQSPHFIHTFESMMTLALDECERFHPALSALINKGHSASNALKQCLIHCEGRA